MNGTGLGWNGPRMRRVSEGVEAEKQVRSKNKLK